MAPRADLPFRHHNRICEIEALQPPEYFTSCSSHHRRKMLFVLPLCARSRRAVWTLVHDYSSLLSNDLYPTAIGWVDRWESYSSVRINWLTDMNRWRGSERRKEERMILNCMSGQPLIGRSIIFCYDPSSALDSPVVENSFLARKSSWEWQTRIQSQLQRKMQPRFNQRSTKKHRRPKVWSILCLDFPTVCDVAFFSSRRTPWRSRCSTHDWNYGERNTSRV